MYEEYNDFIYELTEKFNYLRNCLEIDTKKEEVKSLGDLAYKENFWDDHQEAQKIMQKIEKAKSTIELFDSIADKIENAELAIEIIKQDADESIVFELDSNIKEIRRLLDEVEEKTLLSGPYDQLPAILNIHPGAAILNIHPGAGGTESHDWVDMLLRMYIKWLDNKKFKYRITDYLPGEEAGIKNVTLTIHGLNAYGLLKSEKGIHRLVRISPYDSSKRRHTSFAAVDVIPLFEDDVELEINKDDLRIDTYRSSGAGGQHVNVTDSAVRITHIPSGIVVACQDERSQIMNRETAMKILKSRLFEKKKKKKMSELDNIRGEKKDIAWGSQIRSYVLQPYQMIKDHRTDTEVGDVNSVLNGEIDIFIKAFLKGGIKSS
ncbi:MAG: peptide chain release factor 2 [Actinobacteria bacterium]|nr:peptide chain release factor 2 [Actinomycetota bacterium]